MDRLKKIGIDPSNYDSDILKNCRQILEDAFRAIKQSENYKKCEKVDELLDILDNRAVYDLLLYCASFMDISEFNNSYLKAVELEFEVRLRRIIECMISRKDISYQNREPIIACTYKNFDDLCKERFNRRLTYRFEHVFFEQPHKLYDLLLEDIRTHPERYAELINTEEYKFISFMQGKQQEPDERS